MLAEYEHLQKRKRKKYERKKEKNCFSRIHLLRQKNKVNNEKGKNGGAGIEFTCSFM